MFRNFFVVPLHLFVSISTISRFGECFRDGQYSLVSFLFAVPLLMVPLSPAFVKIEGTCHLPPPVPYFEWPPLQQAILILSPFTTIVVLAHFSKSNSRTSHGLSRTIQGIFKETTITKNGTSISISKQVQSKFDILTVLT